MKKKKEELIKTEIGINKEDIIAVAVSEIEDEIKRRVSSITKEIDQWSTSIRDKENEVKKIYKDKEEEALKGNFVKLEKQVKAINIPFSKSTMEGYELSRVKNFTNDMSHSPVHRSMGGYYEDDEYKMHKGKYVVALVNNAYHEHVELEFPEDELKEISDDIKELTEKRVGLGVKRSKTKAQLSEIPSIERKAKAALARKALSGSVEGQSYLDEMEVIKDGFKQSLNLLN